MPLRRRRLEFGFGSAVGRAIIAASPFFRGRMSRLWDKGAPLDERVLQFTAGEDHTLDERLVAYDVRASISHAQMLQAQGLVRAANDLAICTDLSALAEAPPG